MTSRTQRPLMPLSRRSLLALGTAQFALAAAMPFALRAQDAAPQPGSDPAAPPAPAETPAAPAEPAAQAPAPDAAVPFSFDILTETMRQKALQPQQGSAPLEGFLALLDYDDWRKINFRADRAVWQIPESRFRLQAYHPGWLFKDPVTLYEVTEGQARPLGFSTDDFDYFQDLAERVPQHFSLPGVAGFRLHYPLNRADVMDELISFVGASYFRALGRGNSYGLSARGLAINTGLPGGEEFPRFTSFFLERPAEGRRLVIVNAALESPSCTGAYRFEIRPGPETLVEVTARLFFRADVAQLGVAPLTSMFLYAANNRDAFDDYRPRVHDSDGLRITRQNGDILWRALNNPPRLSVSVFAEQGARSFGLYQRQREFDAYQDAEAHYESRPSLSVEPIGDWGPGSVRLVEIPSALEVNDNIVAFWAPDSGARAGEMREFRYRLHWGALAPDALDELAHVADTRAGHAGVAGSEQEPRTRKFVVDFKGGTLGMLPGDAQVSPVLNITGGESITTVLEKIEGTDIWRLVADVRGRAGEVMELVAHIAGYDRKLSETWLYQWVQE